VSGYRVPAITASTLGNAGANFEELRRDYKWNGDPAKALRPAVAAEPVPLRGSPKKRAEEKRVRLAEFCRLREQGITVVDAGLMVGVERRAASRYELERKAGIEAVKQAGREAWRIHHEQEAAQ
jgi:hypothetical protein